MANLEPLDFMRLLYNLEIIGVEKYGDFTSNYSKRWEAYDFSFNRPNAKAEISSNFLFHPGLWRGLEMM